MRTSTCRGAGPQPSLVPDPRTSTHSFSRDAHWSTAPTASLEAGSTTTRGTTPSTASAGVPRRTASVPSSDAADSEIDALGIRPVHRGKLCVAVPVRDHLVAELRVIFDAIGHFRFLVLESIRQLDERSMLFAGNGIPDRLDCEFPETGHPQTAHALVAITRQRDRHVDGI